MVLNENHTRVTNLIPLLKIQADGLITQLIFPAPKRSNDKNDLSSSFYYSEFDEWEIDRTEIVMKHKLGSGQYGDV